MPIYGYECTKCGHRFEKIQKISARRVGTCPECKGRAERMVHAPAIQFKGSGWYVTDYGGKGKPPKGEQTGESSN
jgi:putative FmdB family regulatory protein